ncbi:MAG: hypothetical protein WBP16_13190 [Ferruginibacter sp.]
MAKILTVLIVACGLQMSATAQENSPYSRYGLGDLTPNHNIFTRGMGGISAGIADNRSINFTNPASLSSTYNTIFDVGTEIDYRILKSSNPAKKFTSANTFISYLQMAFPLTTPKMAKKEMAWGMSIGLKPVSKINYKIETNERIPGIDSLNTLYEGSGGVNQAFLGTGFRIKNFSIGINAGYMFGNKNHSTILTFISDSTFYYTSNSATNTSFGGLFINGGMQYNINLAKDEKGNVTKNLRLGLYGNMQQSINASSDKIREIIFYDPNGGFIRIDSVYDEKNVKGKIKYPAMVGFGFAYQNLSWLLGADFEYGNWNNYRYYGQSDQVQNNWTFRAGAQYYPAKENTPVKKYFNFVKYRAGFYYGPDYINTNKKRPEYGFSIGAGMPLTSLKRISYTGEYVVLNTALEVGNRGNKQTNLRENIVRFSIGLSMNARWFQKPKYN